MKKTIEQLQLEIEKLKLELELEKMKHIPTYHTHNGTICYQNPCVWS